MTRFILAAAARWLLLAALLLHPATLPTASAAAAGPDAIAPGRVIVAFTDKDLTEAQARGRLARLGARLEQWLPELGLARVVVSAGGERAASQRLAAEADIAFATEDRLALEVADTPLDEHWGEQWGPAKVGLPDARDVTRGSASVVIAVVDTGVNYNHWDLREQMWTNPGESEVDPATGARTCVGGIAENGIDDDGNGYVDDCRGYDFVTEGNAPLDQHGHGTFVSGIAAAATNNRGSHTDGTYEGIAGMGGAARLMPVRVMDAGGLGYAFNIAAGIRYAALNGASVINLSIAFRSAPSAEEIMMLCAATDLAQAREVVVVGASGNGYSLTTVSYPAACPGVIAVGASNPHDERAAFSNAGDRLDLVAPGTGIFSALWSRDNDSAYGYYGGSTNQFGNGTSFAAPHVAGAAALVRSLRPDFGQAQTRELLLRTADDVGDPGFDPLTGWGRLNVARAVKQAAVRAYLPVVWQ